MLKNINHLTLTTGNMVTYADNSVILDYAKPAVQAMVTLAKTNGSASVLGSTIIECNINYELGTYIATLYTDQTKQIPLLSTCGTANEQGADFAWETINNMYQSTYGICRSLSQRPPVPFICDFIYPTAIFNLDVLSWSGDFTKCFGIEMMDSFQNPQKSEFIETDSCSQTRSLETYKVGNIYPNTIGKHEGSQFDVTDNGIVIINYVKNPTEQELLQFKSGSPFEMRLLELNNIIFGLFKFGSHPWSDAPYTVHLSHNLSNLAAPEDDKEGYLLQSFVFDTTSGKLCSIRGLKLSNKMSRKLYQMIESQRKSSFNLAQYNQNLHHTYNRFSTKDMLKMTSDYFKIR